MAAAILAALAPILPPIAKLLFYLVKLANDKQLLSAGQKIALAAGLQEAANALLIARAAEAAADAAHRADPTDAAFDPDLLRKDP